MTEGDLSTYNSDDLVFENRNKAYGAYFLRRLYNRHLLIGFLSSLLIILFLNIVPFLLIHMSAWMMGAPQFVEVQMEEPADMPMPPSVEVKLPGYKEVVSAPEKVIKTVVPDFSKIAEEPQKKDSLTAMAGMENKKGEIKSGGPSGDDGFVITEIHPSFPGGRDRMDAFIRINIRYPMEEVERRKQGKVFVSFIVTEEGKLQDIQVVQGVSPLLDAEALRVISMMPPWNPGFRKGKAVAVPVKIPISFKMNY